MSRNAEIERSFEDDSQTWHAVAVAPSWERRVTDALVEAGFEPYLPEMAVTTRRKGLVVMHRRVVIPGYVFVRLAIWADNSWTRIRPEGRFGDGIAGVIGFVSHGGLPAAIPERQMDRLARVEHVEDDIEPILEWLAKGGKIVRLSNKAKRREAAWKRRLAISRAA